MKINDKVVINFYGKKYTDKPTRISDKEAGIIKCNLKPKAMTIADLADNCIHGTSFCPGVLVKDQHDKTKNGMNDASWVQQQLFALDIDHIMTIPQFIDRCKELELTPCFMYTSFSHSDKEDKFRVVFCNNAVVKDGTKRDKIQNILFKLFKYSDDKKLEIAKQNPFRLQNCRQENHRKKTRQNYKRKVL